MSAPFELTDGRLVPVVAEVHGHDDRYVAFVLVVEGEVDGQWWVTWTDGINWWTERFTYPQYALVYLGALVHAADNDEFLVAPEEVVRHANSFLEEVIR